MPVTTRLPMMSTFHSPAFASSSRTLPVCWVAPDPLDAAAQMAIIAIGVSSRMTR